MEREFRVGIAHAAVDGRPVALLAEAAGVARATVYGWRRRYASEVAVHYVPDVGYVTETQLNEIRRWMTDTTRMGRPPDLATSLEDLGEAHQWYFDRIARDREQLDRVWQQLQEEVVLAAAGGLPPALLAEAAKVARTTVYDWKRRYSGQTLLLVSRQVDYITDRQISKMCGWLDEDGDLKLLLHSLGDDFLADLDPKLIRRAVVELHYYGFRSQRRRIP